MNKRYTVLALCQCCYTGAGYKQAKYFQYNWWRMQLRDLCNRLNFLLTMLPLMLSFSKQFDALTQIINVPTFFRSMPGHEVCSKFSHSKHKPSTKTSQLEEKDSTWFPPRLWVGSLTLSLIICSCDRKKSERQIPER